MNARSFTVAPVGKLGASLKITFKSEAGHAYGFVLPRGLALQLAVHLDHVLRTRERFGSDA